MNAARWKRRIERAAELQNVFPAAAELLEFYRRICAFQESIFGGLRQCGRADWNAVACRLPDLRALVATLCSSSERCQAEGGSDEMEEFLSRVLLQPYAEYLASRGDAPPGGEGACPFCGSLPVVGVLRPEAEGAKRSLICSRCATEWVYRRIVCPNCGEAAKDKLPVYKAESITHVRVEACDSCRCYLKSVDLTVNGLAVPVVDELATVALDLWASENGYVKIQTNLLGL